MSLYSMFEDVDCSVILEVLRRNNCDLGRTIDELLTIPVKDQPIVAPTLTDSQFPPLSFASQHLTTESIPINPNPIIEEPQVEVAPVEVHPLVEVPSATPAIDTAKFAKILAKEKKMKEKMEEKIARKTAKILSQKAKMIARESKMLRVQDEPIISDRKDRFKRRSIDKLDEPIKTEQRVRPEKPEKPHRKPIRNISEPIAVVDLHASVPEIPLVLEVPATPVVSAFVPSVQTELTSERESQLLQRIAELEAENARVNEEKRAAMKWVMDEMRNRLNEKDQKLAEFESQIHKLQDALRDSKAQENKLEKLLVHSKDVLVEGVVTLSKGMTSSAEKGWKRVQPSIEKFSVETKESIREAHILEKMREFAQALREEISKVFHLNSDDSDDEEDSAEDFEDLTPEEQEEEQQAKLASLQTFAEERRENRTN